jgi:predicted  nucleic acid-binding Zn-ribbon protein
MPLRLPPPPPLQPRSSRVASALVPLADSYKKAYDDMQAWIADVNLKTAAASDKVEGLKRQIRRTTPRFRKRRSTATKRSPKS